MDERHWKLIIKTLAVATVNNHQRTTYTVNNSLSIDLDFTIIFMVYRKIWKIRVFQLSKFDKTILKQN